MNDGSPLAILVSGYFHQDVFDVYVDEFAAIDDFINLDPALGARLPDDIAVALATYPHEGALEALLDQLGCDIEPRGITYREWLTQIADHVRAATGGGE